METITSTSADKTNRPILFVLFLICGLAIFLISITFAPILSTNIAAFLRICLTAIFLILALVLFRKDKFLDYRQVFFAFFIAGISLLISWLFSGKFLALFGLETDTPNGIAFAKLFESILIVAPILILTKLSGVDFGEIFLKKGRLALGLVVGIVSFLILSALAILQVIGGGVALDKVIPWTPWILIFVLSNGFMEELLFRGLFLKKLAKFFKPWISNLLIALIFTIAHTQVTYTPDLPIFLVVLFLLALAWGYLMQKTDSIWGSALFHAGADMLIIIGIFANFGITT